MTDVLIEKLRALQSAHGWSDDEIAEKCGMKARMYQFVQAGTYRFSRRALGHIVRNFPGLSADVLAYLAEDTEAQAA